MSTRIVCVDPNAVGAHAREIAATGQVARLGDELEIDDADLAESLLTQVDVWARPNSSAAKDAKKAIASWLKLDGAEEASVTEPATSVPPGNAAAAHEHAAAAAHKQEA